MKRAISIPLFAITHRATLEQGPELYKTFRAKQTGRLYQGRHETVLSGRIKIIARLKSVKDELAGKSKRLVGEILGDQKPHDEGKAREKKGADEAWKSSAIKPLGNLDQLT